MIIKRNLWFKRRKKKPRRSSRSQLNKRSTNRSFNDLTVVIPQQAFDMSRESWLVIGCRTCQPNKGGRGQLSHSGEKERSCQTPTIVWNIIRAVQETPSAALLWNSITKGTGMFREEPLDCDIFVNEKTSSPPVCVEVSASVLGTRSFVDKLAS